MSEAILINDACVMAKGQVTIPKAIQAVLSIDPGDKVTFIVEDNTVKVVNSAIYALQCFQQHMKGEGQKAGLFTDEDVAAWITASRRKESSEHR